GRAVGHAGLDRADLGTFCRIRIPAPGTGVPHGLSAHGLRALGLLDRRLLKKSWQHGAGMPVGRRRAAIGNAAALARPGASRPAGLYASAGDSLGRTTTLRCQWPVR